MGEILSIPAPGAIVQRRVGVRLSFLLEADGIKYSSRERLVKREAFIPYEAINPYRQTAMTLERSPLAMNLIGLSILYLLMAAAAGSINAFFAVLFISFSLLAAIAFVIGRLTGWTDLRFTLVPLVGPAPGAWGPVKIVSNASGEKVLEAICSAWREKLKRLYGNADLSAEPARELPRLTWLRDNHVLSELEWQAQVDRLKRADVVLQPASDRPN